MEPKGENYLGRRKHSHSQGDGGRPSGRRIPCQGVVLERVSSGMSGALCPSSTQGGSRIHPRADFLTERAKAGLGGRRDILWEDEKDVQ